jgi:hypothetical protein
VSAASPLPRSCACAVRDSLTHFHAPTLCRSRPSVYWYEAWALFRRTMLALFGSRKFDFLLPAACSCLTFCWLPRGVLLIACAQSSRRRRAQPCWLCSVSSSIWCTSLSRSDSQAFPCVTSSLRILPPRLDSCLNTDVDRCLSRVVVRVAFPRSARQQVLHPIAISSFLKRGVLSRRAESTSLQLLVVLGVIISGFSAGSYPTRHEVVSMLGVYASWDVIPFVLLGCSVQIVCSILVGVPAVGFLGFMLCELGDAAITSSPFVLNRCFADETWKQQRETLARVFAQAKAKAAGGSGRYPSSLQACVLGCLLRLPTLSSVCIMFALAEALSTSMVPRRPLKPSPTLGCRTKPLSRSATDCFRSWLSVCLSVRLAPLEIFLFWVARFSRPSFLTFLCSWSRSPQEDAVELPRSFSQLAQLPADGAAGSVLAAVSSLGRSVGSGQL